MNSRMEDYMQVAFQRSLDSHQEELEMREVLDYSKLFSINNASLEDLSIKNNEREVNVLGDGNCLFRCISHVMFDDQKHHAIVREKMLDYLRMHSADFASSANLDSTLDSWIGRMSNCGNSEFGIGGEFGDAFAVEILSWMLKRPIVIQVWNNQSFTQDVTGSWFTEPVVYLRLRNMHYTLLL